MTNRFQALPVEEPNLEHFNVHTLDIKSPQNYPKATQLPQWNNISLNKAISHKNVLPAPPSMVISKPATPEIAQIKVTKGDLTLGMTNAADDISADNIVILLPHTLTIPQLLNTSNILINILLKNLNMVLCMALLMILLSLCMFLH